MLILVPTPIGNLWDITLRALESFQNAEIVLCEDTRVTKKLFSLLIERGILNTQGVEGRDFIESKQFQSFHSHNQESFIESISKDMFDKNVVYVSDAGMPCISDPGSKLISYAIRHDIAFDVLPGACALNVAFASSGIESTPFIFAGFLPHKQQERRTKLILLSQLDIGGDYSVICYESPHRILDTLKDIASLLPSVFISAHKELTKLHQKRYEGRAEDIIARLEGHNLKGEWVIVLKIAESIKQKQALSYEEVLMLDIPPKIKAKILSKISTKTIKQCYEELLQK
ncbi:16S rRNA (cytidine(1402)-2'-O)-methyltransferase [Helicobacter marmotae]|uniref:Ribosomal RNA small subunit methyltransferase I n=1 Tax=Helicobacter marmotae TaxID=152490 RepID=A0A3D8I5A3_9HELI|nr:16S rRNA (cytidine(1402)-2'-O)-methyltransferase [Helicobacter marmotae]